MSNTADASGVYRPNQTADASIPAGWTVVEAHPDLSVLGPPGAKHGSRLHMSPEQLKAAALRLVMKTYAAGDRRSQDAAMVAHAYLVQIGVLAE